MQVVTEGPPLHIYEPFSHSLEADYLRQILRCAKAIFPCHAAGAWSPRIVDAQGYAAQPDAVLVANGGRTWTVVEVELAHHSIRQHIEPQLTTLSQGIYSKSLVASLYEALPNMPESDLDHLPFGQPEMLCIVNEYTAAISRVCRENGFELAVMEPLHRDLGGWGLLVSQMPGCYRQREERGFMAEVKMVYGDHVFYELPGRFPIVRGEVVVIHDKGEDACRMLGSVPPTLQVPLCVAPGHRRIMFTVEDLETQRVRMEAV